MYANQYDTVISGGYLVDGTGSPGTYTDIAILDGRIAVLGDLEGCEAHDSGGHALSASVSVQRQRCATGRS